MMGLFDLPRIAINANDARALSPDEILRYQAANSAAMQQGSRSLAYWSSLQNIKLLPDKPLDERFADFKVRLAAAIAKRI